MRMRKKIRLEVLPGLYADAGVLDTAEVEYVHQLIWFCYYEPILY